MRTSKKASGIGDLIYVFLILFITAFVIMITYEPRMEFEESLEDDNWMDEEVLEHLQEHNVQQTQFWDDWMIVILAFVTIILLISSYFIDSHPVFFFVFLILLVLLIVISAMMSNAYIEVSLEDNMTAAVAAYPKINWLMANWPIVLLVQGILVAMVLYTKFRLIEQ
ncbi:MAG: hypothetical protein ACLFTR_03440 [Candidatus Woesearchaeota archaeon]